MKELEDFEKMGIAYEITHDGRGKYRGRIGSCYLWSEVVIQGDTLHGTIKKMAEVAGTLDTEELHGGTTQKGA